jgi:hypothetical protein
MKKLSDYANGTSRQGDRRREAEPSARWPVWKSVLFVVGISLALWGSIVAGFLFFS